MTAPNLIDRLLLALGLRRARLTELAARLREPYDDANSPHELFDVPEFVAGVDWIAARLRAGDEIEPFVAQKGPIVALMAVEAATKLGNESQALALLVRVLAAQTWLWA